MKCCGMNEDNAVLRQEKCKRRKRMKVALGADGAGYVLKEAIKKI